jgi:hypothetical protein
MNHSKGRAEVLLAILVIMLGAFAASLWSAERSDPQPAGSRVSVQLAKPLDRQLMQAAGGALALALLLVFSVRAVGVPVDPLDPRQ